MNIDLALFQELYSNGFAAIPLLWDSKNKDATKYPEHDPKKVDVTIGYVEQLLKNGFNNSNALAIKLIPPNGMLDFDLKNTENKNIYHEWFNIIVNTNEDLLSKICIEETRNGGYHVYFKYAKLKEKLWIARANGSEVISLYTGGLLSYCYPTPGYKIIHNDLASIELITDDEYDLLISTAAFFNEDKDTNTGESKIQLIDYPVEYESTCLQFDEYITDDAFETLLNSIGLFKTDKIRRRKWVAFLRKGSTANYSAKVYFKSKRVLIFSASMSKYPNWHDSAHAGDTRWTLSPAKILFYKNNRDWQKTIEEIKIICDSAMINISEPETVYKPVVNKLKFPYDIFPEPIQDYIFNQVIQHEYLAGSIIVALSACIGNSCTLEAMDGYIVKPILYMAIVAPPGASKSPAIKKCFDPIQVYDDADFKRYEHKLSEYKQQLASYERNKQTSDRPEKPVFHQIIINDSTIEMVFKILSLNSDGCCLVADELSGFMKRMNQYKDGDEVQKWLELWSGSTTLLQRISRDESKVKDPFCSIIGGIQPGVLEALSKEDNQHNGFYHRFLFVYPEPQEKVPWQQISVPIQTRLFFHGIFEILLEMRQNKAVYRLSVDANKIYEQWFEKKNAKYNRAQTEHIKGIIAKYQDYCLRLALLLQVVYDFQHRSGIIDAVNMERAIRLTEYFFVNMNKALKILIPETPADKLQAPYDKIYAQLPNNFTMKTVIAIAATFSIKESTIKSFVRRNTGFKNNIFIEISRNSYEKAF